MICQCGHEKFDHRYGRACEMFSQTGFRNARRCPCKMFDDAVLPAPGERLEFGKHHLRTADAEAEAWPVGERKIARVIRRSVGLPS